MTSLSQTIRDHLSPETIVASLGSPQRAERYLATEHLKTTLDQESYRSELTAALTPGTNPSPLFLDALSAIAAVGQLSVFESLVALLDQADVAVRRSAARVIAHCFASRCSEISPWFADGDIRFECCFAHDWATVSSLMQWYVEQGRIPDIAFGLSLTPRFLYNLASRFPQQAPALAQQFGYIEGLNLNDAMPLLECGVWCVPSIMLHSDQRQLEQRTEQVVATLLSILAGQSSIDDLVFDPHHDLDISALCGAVRSLDHQSLLQHRFENRLHPRLYDNNRRALCKHAPFDFCRKTLISNALREVEQFGVPQAFQGRFVVEHAGVLVTHDSNLRVERMNYLKSRWARRADRRWVVPSHWKFPVEHDADAPELKYRVLTVQQLTATRGYLDAPSPGASAAARLLKAVGRDDCIKPLFTLEERLSGILCPVGIEVQIPFSARRETESLAWKQALRAMGVPSPRRPEYRTMVEVAFPPSRSYQPQVLLPLILEQLGLFSEPVDMALHLSFSGYLGPDVRYLLFAQQFINLPMIIPRGTRLSRLMSKGFAHVNYDSVPLDGVNHDGVRTELRACRFGYHGAAHATPLERHFIDDIIETSLLVAAKQSPNPLVNCAWLEYTQRIEAAALKLPDVFGTLLYSDWFASTEEPTDEGFARRLPISQAWISTHNWVRTEGMAVELRNMFREIRSSCAAEAIRQLDVKSTDDLGNAESRCGARYFDPAIP
ncbi:MAG: hypothetical protein JWM11_6817 [Planctomycetaceae bacterium]|nr:hypothetical protein [Planctomycetaceae bacterium]